MYCECTNRHVLVLSAFLVLVYKTFSVCYRGFTTFIGAYLADVAQVVRAWDS